MADTVRVQINPEAVNLESVAASLPPPADAKWKMKSGVVKVTRSHGPVEVSAEGAAALKEASKGGGVDANGKVVDGVVDAPPADAQPDPTAQNRGDMSAKDLEAGGKKPSTK